MSESQTTQAYNGVTCDCFRETVAKRTKLLEKPGNCRSRRRLFLRKVSVGAASSVNWHIH
jgi:hypothetical protein